MLLVPKSVTSSLGILQGFRFLPLNLFWKSNMSQPHHIPNGAFPTCPWSTPPLPPVIARSVNGIFLHPAPTKAETWVSSSLHFLHFPLILSPHILVITNSYIYLKSTHFCNWHRRCACSKKNSWFIPLTFQFPALTVFPTPCISARKKLWNLSWLFALPHPTSQKILLSLPLTYIQILTTSRCHPCYPDHATKTSCLDYCIGPAHAASGCSYVQFPTWKPK